MTLNSLTARFFFATLGMLLGAVWGGAISYALTILLSVDGVLGSNCVAVGTCLGIAIGYGVYRRLHSRFAKAHRPTSDETSY